MIFATSFGGAKDPSPGLASAHVAQLHPEVFLC